MEPDFPGFIYKIHGMRPKIIWTLLLINLPLAQRRSEPIE